MIKLNPRVLIGVGVTGILGIGGYGIYAAVKKDEIIYEFLTRKGFHFLNTDGSADDDGWSKKVDAYKKKTQTDPSLDEYIKNADGSDSGNKEIDKDKMKEICADLVRKPARDENKLKQAEKWCAKDKVS